MRHEKALSALFAMSLPLLATTPDVRAETWTLPDAIREAQENSPTARLAQQRIAQARAGLAQTRAAFWPLVQLETSYSVTNNSAMAFGHILNQEAFSPNLNFNDVASVDDLNARATVDVPLFTGLRRFARKDAAEAAADAAGHGAEAVRNELAFRVAHGFFAVLEARALIRAAKAAVASFEQNLEIARRRHEAGTLLEQALLDLEVRLAQAREDLVRAENGEALAKETLKSVMGITDDTFDVAPDATLTPSPPEASQARAELSAQAAAVRRTEASIRVARAGYWPRAKAFASLIFDQGFIEDGNKLSYMAGVGVEWTVWDGLLTAHRVRQAEAEAAAARAALDRARLDVRLEVAQARIRLQEARGRLEVTDKAVDLAEESVRLTRVRFEQGLALATQLIDAETALTGARVRRAKAEAALNVAVAAYNKALGRPQVEAQ